MGWVGKIELKHYCDKPALHYGFGKAYYETGLVWECDKCGKVYTNQLEEYTEYGWQKWVEVE